MLKHNSKHTTQEFSPLDMYPRRNENVCPHRTCTQMLIGALFLIDKRWKQRKCPSVDEWVNKRWSLYTTEYESTLKRNEALAHATMWTPLGNMTPGERSQVPNTALVYDSIHTEVRVKRRTESEKSMVRLRASGGGQEERQGQLKDTRLLSEVTNVLNLTRAMVVHVCD